MGIRKFFAAGCCVLISLTSCGKTVERVPRKPVSVITTSTTTLSATTSAVSTQTTATAYIASDTVVQSTAAVTAAPVQTAAIAAAATSAAVQTTSAPPRTTASTAATTTQTTTTEIAASLTKEKLPQCKSAAFYCRNDDSYLYSDSINMCIAPAGLVKLATAATALKYTELSDRFTVGSEMKFVDSDAIRADLAQGNILTMNDLIAGMLIASGNDAAYTIAVSAARAYEPDADMSDSEAVDCFVDLMNKFAYNIGMYNTNFTNPDGWDDADQYTTVSDLMRLADYVLNDPQLSDIVSTHYKYVTFQTGQYTDWINTNQLLNAQSARYIPECIGIKTGTTDDGGSCLLSAFSKNGKTYISAVTGCLSDDDCYDITLKMFNSLT